MTLEGLASLAAAARRGVCAGSGTCPPDRNLSGRTHEQLSHPPTPPDRPDDAPQDLEQDPAQAPATDPAQGSAQTPATTSDDADLRRSAQPVRSPVAVLVPRPLAPGARGAACARQEGRPAARLRGPRPR